MSLKVEWLQCSDAWSCELESKQTNKNKEKCKQIINQSLLYEEQKRNH